MFPRLGENAQPVRVTVERVQSPLGAWTTASHRPEGELARHVGRVIALQGRYFGTSVRSLARPAPELFINLREGSRSLSPEGAWMAGIRETPVLLPSDGLVDFVAVRFRATGAWTLFGCRGDEIANRIVSAADLAASLATNLRDRLSRVREPTARVRLVVQALDERLPLARRCDPAVAAALSRCGACDEAQSITEICAELGVSRRRLVDGFRREVGLTPKRFARLVRFHEALDRVIGRGGMLAAIAADCGFADQPHMTGEFRRFGDQSPARLRSEAHTRIDRFRFGLPRASAAPFGV
jgi:AraC-like DNA-binding protein